MSKQIKSYDPRRNLSKSRTAMTTCEAATTAAQNASSARHTDRRNDLSASLLNKSSRYARPLIVMDDTINKCAWFPKSTSFSIPASSSSRTNGRSSWETLKGDSAAAFLKILMCFTVAASFFAMIGFCVLVILVCYGLFNWLTTK